MPPVARSVSDARAPGRSPIRPREEPLEVEEGKRYPQMVEAIECPEGGRIQGEVWRRSKLLVAVLLGEVLDEEEVSLPDLVALGAATKDDEGLVVWSEKTVSNVVRDLADFGAFRVVQRTRKDRAVRLTILGLAWIEGELLPRDLKDLRVKVGELFGEEDEEGEGS